MSKSGRYKNLFSNMALFTVGNFVSKLLVMLLVPFYTNVLTTAEYGIADGMQATLLLLVPLLTINIGEAALRFGIERANSPANGHVMKSQGDVLRVLIKYIGIADGIVVSVCALLYFILGKNSDFGAMRIYAILFAGLFICNSLYEGMILFCQGCERVQIMVIGTISCTILVIASNIVMLLVIRMGLLGYIISQMVSFMGAALIMLGFMILGEGVLEKKTKDDISGLEKDMTRYGRSMLLYSTSSWINNALDRYFVLGMCGAAANGLYGVAYKIPAILTVFQRIFAQAWQISANKSYTDEDATRFFTQVYNGYQTIMIIGCSGLIMLVKLAAYLLFAKDFFVAWQLVPPLLISVVFGALTGFLGSICLAYKDGKSMGYATGVGAMVNIALNFIGIKLMGPLGAAVATMISYFTMYMMAYYYTSKHVRLDVNRVRDMIAYAVVVFQAVSIMLELPHFYVIQLACLLVVFMIYGRSFAKIVMDKIRR